MFYKKARMFLLVDLQEFFSDLGLGGRKKSSENDQLIFNFTDAICGSLIFEENKHAGFISNICSR